MAHDITKDVIGVKEFEVQDINKSGEPVNFLGSISLSNHIVNKGYVDAEIVDKSWLKTTAQTGLTGDKTGSFNLTTTGNIIGDIITASNNTDGVLQFRWNADTGINHHEEGGGFVQKMEFHTGGIFVQEYSVASGTPFINMFGRLDMSSNAITGVTNLTASGTIATDTLTSASAGGITVGDDLDLGANDLLFTGSFESSISAIDGEDMEIKASGILTMSSNSQSGPKRDLIYGLNGELYSVSSSPPLLGLPSIPWNIAYINTIDLGTNTIDDVGWTGNMEVDGNLTVTGTVQAGATTLTASTEPILKLEDTGALNSDREWIQMFNKDSVKMIEIGTISNGNPEIRFGDAESTKVGFPPSDPTYFAFINDSTEMWLGNAADPSLYYNFYNGANVNWGRSVNLQTGNFYGDFKIREGDLTMPKTSGKGIKVDIATPTFGFRDLLGDVISRNTGANKPTLTTYRGTLQDFQFGVNDQEHFKYHIPHDYVKGTDIFIHIHWSHTGAFVTGGTVTFEIEQSYAKGHNQAPFHAPVTATYNGTASTVQYQHILSETQSSASTPTGLQIDTDDLEPDGVIILRMLLNANNITVSEGLVPDPFIHYVDIHYQSTNIATKARAPDFYA